jgi:hypothetical protein
VGTPKVSWSGEYNTCFLQGEEFFFGDAVLFRVQPPGTGKHGGGTTCVDVMHNAVERFGGNSSSSCCTCGRRAATVAAVPGLQGVMKEVVLALEKVRP